MSISLTPSTGAREDFIGEHGGQVTLKVKGSGVELVHARYAEEVINSDPAAFTIQKGTRMLVVVVEGAKAGALVQLIEESSDDANEEVLDRFHYDPMNPARGYIVRGN